MRWEPRIDRFRSKPAGKRSEDAVDGSVLSVFARPYEFTIGVTINRTITGDKIEVASQFVLNCKLCRVSGVVDFAVDVLLCVVESLFGRLVLNERGVAVHVDDFGERRVL